MKLPKLIVAVDFSLFPLISSYHLKCLSCHFFFVLHCRSVATPLLTSAVIFFGVALGLLFLSSLFRFQSFPITHVPVVFQFFILLTTETCGSAVEPSFCLLIKRFYYLLFPFSVLSATFLLMVFPLTFIHTAHFVISFLEILFFTSAFSCWGLSPEVQNTSGAVRLLSVFMPAVSCFFFVYQFSLSILGRVFYFFFVFSFSRWKARKMRKFLLLKIRFCFELYGS